ncbi:hypothetical protein GCM10023340_07520 [Nocardioides marinquilinus]|uniref:DUF2867 domain-containing protein n=1 Tax=Nocardioides marinquilinus TaxID=1210400 RepID=A0ABP9PBG5_9ACTN
MDRGRTLRSSRRSSALALDPASVWAVAASGEDGPQWYVDAAPFAFRRAIDRLALGPALKRRPPGRPLLETGDEAGFWRVVEADHDAHRLTLQAIVRAPGTVTLEVVVHPDDAGSRLELVVAFAPRGVLGTAYLLADLPAREALTELVMLHVLTVVRRHEAGARDNRSWPRAVDQV